MKINGTPSVLKRITFSSRHCASLSDNSMSGRSSGIAFGRELVILASAGRVNPCLWKSGREHMARTIYLDYNATTPLDPQVREAMLPYLDGIYGNPSSVHHVGRQARSLLDDARDRAATVLGCKPSEMIFTSGGYPK